MPEAPNCAQLLYLACGSRSLQIQALYAAYSAVAYKSGVNLAIHVFSDSPASFRVLENQICVHAVTPAQVKSWRGPGKYAYRMKIAALSELSSRFSESPILFVDSDTFFIDELGKVLSRIDSRHAVLHRKEYPVLTCPTGQLQRFRRRMGKFRFRGSFVDLNADMWNSGVIGLHPSQFHLLNTVLAFIDAISPKYNKQLVEQYAVSYFLQKNVEVRAADDCVFHYWQQKEEYQSAIEPKLQAWTERPLGEALAELRANRIVLPPFQPRHGWVRRLRDRILQEPE